MVGIYKITNPKGKVYIGQSKNIIKRKNGYKRLECKGQTKLYNSLIKYGWENHKFEIIEECNYKIMNEREEYYITQYNSIIVGLNIRGGGVGGGSLSQETKDKISKALKGRKNTWTKKGIKGHIYTKEQKEKMRKPRGKYNIIIESKGSWEWSKGKLISPKQIIEIRDKFEIGGVTKSQLSREYNVSWGTIKDIIEKRNSYKNLQ